MKKLFGLMALGCALTGCSATASAHTPDCAVVEADSLDTSPGQAPQPGSCPKWDSGEPPGDQPPPAECAELGRGGLRGSWVLHLPNEERLRLGCAERGAPGGPVGPNRARPRVRIVLTSQTQRAGGLTHT